MGLDFLASMFIEYDEVSRVYYTTDAEEFETKEEAIEHEKELRIKKVKSTK